MVERAPHPGPLPIGSADSADAEREKRSQRLGDFWSWIVQGFNARNFLRKIFSLGEKDSVTAAPCFPGPCEQSFHPLRKHEIETSLHSSRRPLAGGFKPPRQHLWWNLDGQENGTCLYGEIFDPAAKAWHHLATINCPNGGYRSVETLGGGVNSILENFSGEAPQAPRLAIYRLWLGTAPENMKCLTRAVGDGQWGVLHDTYFLAAGGTNEK
jgi:hypothetical protein